MTLSAFTGSGSRIISSRIRGITCHDTPYLSFNLEGYSHYTSFWFSGDLCRGFSVMGNVANLRILKNRHIKMCRLFGLVIEPQVWSNFLQVLGHDNSSLCFWLYGYI